MSLKEKIENNLTLSVLGLLFAGFAAGLGAYKALPTTGSPSEDKTQSSPYVHWWSGVTDLPLQKCEDVTRDAFRVTGTKETEDMDRGENSVSQIGVAGSITSAIIFVRIGEKTTVTVVSSGPDQTATKNRNARLSEVVQSKLNH
jgi:hypothetical protein